ncbi:hypothetical protein H4582DRAFT_511058 [Lactarius indigo]|nr:hypothetical protein H4582DRAFT_511058 [Lactarius indigo]
MPDAVLALRLMIDEQLTPESMVCKFLATSFPGQLHGPLGILPFAWQMVWLETKTTESSEGGLLQLTRSDQSSSNALYSRSHVSTLICCRDVARQSDPFLVYGSGIGHLFVFATVLSVSGFLDQITRWMRILRLTVWSFLQTVAWPVRVFETRRDAVSEPKQPVPSYIFVILRRKLAEICWN